MGLRTEWLGPARVRSALLAVLVAAGLVPVLSRQASWLGSWKMALDWGTFSITTLGPVAAGIACSVYVRIRRSQVSELLCQAARPWVGWLAPAVGVWASASAAVLVVCAFTTVAASSAGATAFPAVLWVVPPALAVLGAQVGVGALLGSLIGHYWAAPWAAVVTFTLFILTSVSVIPAVFRTGGVSGSLAGETFHPRTFVLQGVAALGFAAGAMALSSWDLFRMSSFAGRVVTLLAVGGAAVALHQLGGDHERYQLEADVDLECRGAHPAVCMAEETTRPLDDVAAKMQRLAQQLDAAGVRLPDRFVQRVGTPRPDDGALSLIGDEELAGAVSWSSAAASLAAPADCSAYYSDSPDAFPERLFAIRDLLERWILVRDGQEPAPSGDHSPADWWSLPPEQQWPWVRATYDALRDCRLFDLRLPVPNPATPR